MDSIIHIFEDKYVIVIMFNDLFYEIGLLYYFNAEKEVTVHEYIIGHESLTTPKAT